MGEIKFKLENSKIIITKSFDSPINLVWRAWTEARLLDQWWAPKPFHIKTKSMDFRDGGMWLYAMVSPNSEKHWCKAIYKSIDSQRSISYSDSFCDENGKENTAKPSSVWTILFSKSLGITNLNITLNHKSNEEAQKMIELGFKDGFTMALENLDNLLRNPAVFSAKQIIVEAIVNAPLESVWKRWTSPEDIINWNCASDDWHCPEAVNDLRAGGKFMSRMEAKDGSFGFEFEGIYDVVIFHSKITYTLTDGRMATTTFESINTGTRITTTFDAERENSVQMQKDGWQAILNNFKKYVEAKTT